MGRHRITGQRGSDRIKVILRSVEIDELSDCWTVMRPLTPSGYCVVNGVLAHRAMYEKHKGAIPNGAILRHTCNNKACVNPDHLKIGNHVDNMRDLRRLRREAKGKHGLVPPYHPRKGRQFRFEFMEE